jgi:uncharacterized protein (DUF58 family)
MIRQLATRLWPLRSNGNGARPGAATPDSDRSAQDAARSPQFLDPAVLARIGDLELVAKTVVEGFLSGLHRSPHLGVSTDFAEHRPYQPGDDVRRIDWKLYGRTDRLSMKEFEAETNTTCGILLDVSGSMRYGSRPEGPTKLDYARTLAACLAYFSNRQRDRVALATFDDDVVEWVPPSMRHLARVLHTIGRAQAGDGRRSADGGDAAGLTRPLNRIAEQFRRRSLIVLISDLYEDPQRLLGAMARLRGRGNDIIVLHVLDPAELDFPFEEASAFEDLESGESIPVVPDSLRDRYTAMMADHVAAVRKALGGAGIDYALLNTVTPLDHALFEYLSTRERLSRVR